MNDRYLYRAKRMDNGEWVEGNLVWSDDADDDYKAIIIPTTGSNMFTRGGSNGDLGFEKWYRVDPSTICQCTGRKDKNSNLIWENDVCKYYNPEDKDGIAIIKEDYASWISGTIRQTEIMAPMFYLKCCEEWEVIGNIFDNPELLEK